MGLIHRSIFSIHKLSSMITCSVKIRDVFESVQKFFGVPCELRSLDVEARWSSTFEMIKISNGLNLVFARLPDIEDYTVLEIDCVVAS